MMMHTLIPSGGTPAEVFPSRQPLAADTAAEWQQGSDIVHRCAETYMKVWSCMQGRVHANHRARSTCFTP